MTNIGPAAYHLHQQPGHLGHGYGSLAHGPSFPPSFPTQQYSQPQYSAQQQQAPPPNTYQQFQQQNFSYGNFQPQSNASLALATSSSKCENEWHTIFQSCNPSYHCSCIAPACHTCQKRHADRTGYSSSSTNLYFRALQPACLFDEYTPSNVPTWTDLPPRAWSPAAAKYGSTCPTLPESYDATATSNGQRSPGATSTASERRSESEPSLAVYKLAITTVSCTRESTCYCSSRYQYPPTARSGITPGARESRRTIGSDTTLTGQGFRHISNVGYGPIQPSKPEPS